MPNRSNADLNNKWFWAATVIAAVASFAVVIELKGGASKTANPPSANVIEATLTNVVNQLNRTCPRKLTESPR